MPNPTGRETHTGPHERRILLAILATGLLLRIGWTFFSHHRINTLGAWGDQGEAMARNMLIGKGYLFSWFPLPERRSFRMPLPTLWLYAVWSITGVNILAAKLSLALLSTLNIWLTSLWARRSHGETAGLIAGGMAAIFPSLIHWPQTLGPETLATTFLLLSMLMLSSDRSVFAGLAAGLLALTRPAYLFFIAVIGLWTLFRDRGRAVAFALSATLVLAPWVFRNARIHDALVIGSTEGGQTFLECNNPASLGSDGRWQHQFVRQWPGIQDLALSLGEVGFDRWAYRQGMTCIRQAPLRYLRAIGLRMWYIWRPWPNVGAGSKHTAFYAAVIGIVWVPTFLLAAWLVLRERCWRNELEQPVLLTLATVTLVSSLWNGVIRYRAPLEPFVIVYASAALLRAIRAIRP